MKNKVWCVLLALIFPVIAYANTTKLNDITVQEKKGATHLRFVLSDAVTWRVFSLENPARVIIDFADTNSAFNIKNMLYPKSRIENIREGHPKPHVLRIVLDVAEGVHYKMMSRQAVSVVKLDLLSKEKVSVSEHHQEKAEKTSFFSKAYRAKRRDKSITIVIDPGHGGKDPGALGQNGTREKDVVLSIAKILANLINEQPNMHAVLTRNNDTFVSLRKRLQIARQHKADLFIAIHADSYFNNNAAGASVYSLSHHGASSVAARWLAQRENHSELDGVALNDLEDQSLLLRSVLLDLAQTATQKASLHCGKSLLDALTDVTKLHYSRVEQAPFMVLKSPDIPSVLVETGFISNIHEEKRLRNKKHQYKMAQALLEGVLSFQKQFLVKEG